MRPDVVQLVMFAQAKPTLAPLSCPSCEASMTRDHFCGRTPNIKSTLSSQHLPSQCVLVFWLLSNPIVFAGELPTMSVCHWMFNGRQTFMSCSLKEALFAPPSPQKRPLWAHPEWSETAKFAGRTFKAALVRLHSQLIIVCGTVLTSEIANSFIITILSPIRRGRSCRFRNYFHANSWTTPVTLSQTRHKVVILEALARCNLWVLSRETCSIKPNPRFTDSHDKQDMDAMYQEPNVLTH